MKEMTRATLYHRLAKFIELYDAQGKELRTMIDRASEEEYHRFRRDLQLFERAASTVGYAKLRNVLQRKPSRREEIRFLAKCASRDLEASARLISWAAKKGDKLFFVTLGKCLSGENKEDNDRLSFFIAWVVNENPSITAKDAVRELKRRGGWTLSEDHFRVIKKRLGLSKPARRRAGRSRKV
jgi:hypothetical protein